MGIIYNETAGPFKGSLSALDPNSCFLTHLRNYYYLDFIVKNSNDWREKAQAEKEVGIATKKMDWWKKRPGFDDKFIESEMKKIKAEWSSK